MPRRRIAVAAEPGNAESRAEGQRDSDDINDVWGWDGDLEAAGASDTSYSSGDDGLQTALRISTGAAIDTEVGSVLRGFAIDVLDESGEWNASPGAASKIDCMAMRHCCCVQVRSGLHQIVWILRQTTALLETTKAMSRMKTMTE